MAWVQTAILCPTLHSFRMTRATSTGGLKGAKTAITQQGKVGQFRDLEGSVTHAQTALEALHNSGSALSDAKMVAAMSDPHSTIGQYVNGQLVRGNLNDQQVQALGALNQLRERIGILRSTTGGTAAEAQAQRMLETLPTAGDSPAIVRNKLKEINGVLSPDAERSHDCRRPFGRWQEGVMPRRGRLRSLPSMALSTTSLQIK